ncbi:MAG: exo-alpha-sialidase, partial [Actinomycetota bacterium]|nr:exo-alpha-sialidase [Actinomycetota bacterium]
GLNPRDGALFIATHTGLFRLDQASKQAARTSDSHQDTMGFAVVGADRMIGSGHPDLRTQLPPLLGLIESRDAGKTWTPISLLGSADFHALRVTGDAIVGYDATNQRIMASRDSGRTWQERRVSEPLIDLVAARSGQVIIAATQTQLRRSNDGGRTWRELSEAPGLLAWPRANRLFLLTGDGRLWRSPDQGRRWEHVSEVGAQPTAFTISGEAMYAALLDGSIQHSLDGGRSWELLTRLT